MIRPKLAAPGPVDLDPATGPHHPDPHTGHLDTDHTELQGKQTSNNQSQ